MFEFVLVGLLEIGVHLAISMRMENRLRFKKCCEITLFVLGYYKH